MSVNVRIKQNSIFRKKLNIDDIIKLSNLSYGICDENYRLIKNEKANHTLLYDENRLARGIDISIEGTDIVLLLSLPTSVSEIKIYYELIDKICRELKTKNYYREGEYVSLKDNGNFIEFDIQAAIAGLKDFQERVGHNEYERFEIFGIYNPISIGIKETEQIGSSLDKLENYLHKIQSLDVYYAAPKVYRVNNK